MCRRDSTRPIRRGEIINLPDDIKAEAIFSAKPNAFWRKRQRRVRVGLGESDIAVRLPISWRYRL